MNEAEVRTFLLGAAVGLAVMGVLWWLFARRRQRNIEPPVIIQQIQLPVSNPTSSLASDGDDNTSVAAPDTAAKPGPIAAKPGPNAVEEARYHRRLRSLTLELERVEQENAELKGRWRTSQNQLVRSEAGLDQARTEIAEIRGIVLELGATRTDQDVIDLR